MVELLGKRRDVTGAAALRALSRIDPDRAVSQLPRVVDTDLFVWTQWYLPVLLQVRPDATRNRLLAYMRGAENPWAGGMIYQGYDNDMDPPTVDQHHFGEPVAYLKYTRVAHPGIRLLRSCRYPRK